MRHMIADPVVHREHHREADDDQLRLELSLIHI